jgi:hypothetical protein
MKALKSDLADKMLQQNKGVRFKDGTVVLIDGIRYTLKLVPSAK